MNQLFQSLLLFVFIRTGAAEIWQTNGPAVFVLRDAPSATTNRPPHKREFIHYKPGTLNHAIWTNLIVLTNSRTSEIWAERSHPRRWPSAPPIVRWNTNGILFGMKGFTALSPCWEGEGAPGAIPITAISRRHGYTSGHGYGQNGFHSSDGRRVWFVTGDDLLIERRIKRAVVRNTLEAINKDLSMRKDYAIVLFDRDLPEGIDPIAVVHPDSVWTNYPRVSGCPWTLFNTEQRGHVSLDLPGWLIETRKPGDSGSPNLLPLPVELVLLDGRSSTPPTASMQKDMDQLCRQEHLDPALYQLQWKALNQWWPQ